MARLNPNQNDDISNKIQVQLKLIDNREIDNLQKVFSLFRTDIESLNITLGTTAEKLESAAKTLASAGSGGGGGGTSGMPGWSRTETGMLVPAVAPMIHTSTPTYQSPTPGGGGGSAFTPPPPPKPGDGNPEGPGVAQWRNILANNVQHFMPASLAADVQSQLRDPQMHWKEAALAGGVAVGGAAALGQAVGMGQRGIGTAVGMVRHPSRIVQPLRASGSVAFGQDLGYNRNGAMGLPIFSAASRYAIGTKLNSLTHSWFGMDPNYSSAQADEAQGLIAGAGYSGGDRDKLANSMKMLNENTGIDQKGIMQLQDMGMRYGGDAGLSSMNQAILGIPYAARAARMSVNQFTTELIAAGNSVASASGMSAMPGIATSQVGVLSGATGFGPASSASALNNNLTTTIAASENGGNLFQTLYGPHRGSKTLAVVQQLVGSVTGYTWAQLQGLQKAQAKDPNAKRQLNDAMNRLAWAYKANPELFGSYDPSQIAKLLSQPGMLSNMRGLETVQNALTSGYTSGHASDRSTIADIMHDTGLSAQLQTKDRMHWAQLDAKGSTQSYQDKLKYLQDQLNQRGGATEQDRRRVQLTLTPGAARLLKFVNPSDVAPSDRVYEGTPQGWSPGTKATG